MESKEFIEVVNWNKYQERIPEKSASWFKVHCSLANCDAFQKLDCRDQMLLIGIWMHAAESGKNIMPADPKYLFRNIRLCKSAPDLKPLLEARDEFGRPNPFIRYCDKPVFDDSEGGQKPDKESSRKTDKESGQERSQKRTKRVRSKNSKKSVYPLYKNAVKIAAYHGRISERKLRIKLRIGESRAKTIISLMRENHLLGDYIGGRGFRYLTAHKKTKTEKRRVEKSREDKNTDKSTETLSGFGRKKEEKNKSSLKAEQKQSKAQTEQTCKATSNPISPNSSTKADEPGQEVKDNRMSRPPDNRIGNIINMQSYRYSPDAMEFALDVILKLGVINSDEYDRLHEGNLYLSRDQAAERGNWAAAWQRASSEFSPEIMSKLKTGILKRIPVAIVRGPQTGTTAERYLRTCWNNLVRDVRRKCRAI